VSGIVYLVSQSSAAFFVSLFSGVLIDIDHIFDYYFQKGVTLRLDKIYACYEQLECEYVVILFHSVELLLLLWVFIAMLKLDLLWVAFAIGLTQHVISDIISNHKFIYSYSYLLSYRITRGFKTKKLLR
jgi:hypothetical protein